MQREMMMEFRTPQHPSMGTNNWGGASPLLARSIPKESLEQRYLRLNSIRTRDEIFPAMEDNFLTSGKVAAPDPDQRQREYTSVEPPARASRRGLLSRLMMGRWREKQASPARPARAAPATLGQKKKRWFGRWDPQNRWPQGWC